jgi:hypothetical protein
MSLPMRDVLHPLSSRLSQCSYSKVPGAHAAKGLRIAPLRCQGQYVRNPHVLWRAFVVPIGALHAV